MIVRLPALSGNMTLENARATSTCELYALRLTSAFPGHVTGIAGFSTPHSLVVWTTIIRYDSMMASEYTIVCLGMDSRNSAGMMFYSPVN